MPQAQLQSSPLLRPAIIELRYETQTQFNDAMAVYERLLHTNIEEVSGSPTNVCTFRVGYGKYANNKDIMLRLTYPLGALKASDSHTVIYWKVAGKDHKALVDTDKVLQGQDMTSVDIPGGYKAINTTALADVPERSLLRDNKTGTLMGLTINPPVPTATSIPEDGSVFQLEDLLQKIHLDGGLSHLLLAALLGVVTFRLGIRRGWNKGLQMRQSSQTVAS